MLKELFELKWHKKEKFLNHPKLAVSDVRAYDADQVLSCCEKLSGVKFECVLVKNKTIIFKSSDVSEIVELLNGIPDKKKGKPGVYSEKAFYTNLRKKFKTLAIASTYHETQMSRELPLLSSIETFIEDNILEMETCIKNPQSVPWYMNASVMPHRFVNSDHPIKNIWIYHIVDVIISKFSEFDFELSKEKLLQEIREFYEEKVAEDVLSQ